jgi:hypothetical protein
MRARCANPTNPRYGAAGITVCSRWLRGEYGISGFDFVEDVGPTPIGSSVSTPARIFRGELSLDAQRSHPTRRPPHPRMSNS